MNNTNMNGDIITAATVPIPVNGAPQAAAPVAAVANGTNNASGNAMHLFAPDPNAGTVNDPLQLDELFHDCYFADFGVPEAVKSLGLGGTSISPAPVAPIIAPNPAVKRTAEQAGLTTAATAGIVTNMAAPGAPAAPPSLDPVTASALVLSSSVPPVSQAPAASLTVSQRKERRDRNREHAKRSRLRKKFLLESLQEQIEGLQSEIHSLKDIIKQELPDKAADLLRGFGDGEGDNDDPSQPKKGAYTPLPMPSGFGPVKTLMEPDYRLMNALSGSQQNFAIADPSLPDNPIVYVSQGFLNLTGYTLDQVLGRNCRFLQGPGTDQAAVDVIRKGVQEGVDTSVCLLNYKADGTPFWNQFFVAALRDAENNVVNFVGVQCEVSKAVVEKHISEGKTPASAMPGS